MAEQYVTTVDAVALAAATAKSVLELITGASTRAIITSWWVEFDGVTASNVPVKVEVCRASAGITGTTITAVKYKDYAPAAITTVKHTATVEGTVTDVLEIHRVSPTSGILVQYPLGREIEVPISSFLRLRLTAAAVVNATVGFAWEE